MTACPAKNCRFSSARIEKSYLDIRVVVKANVRNREILLQSFYTVIFFATGGKLFALWRAR